MKRSLNEMFNGIFHIVAQIIEAQLVVRAVGDVRPIGITTSCIIQPMHDRAHAQAQEAVHLSHPFRISLGQEVVGCDHVNTRSGQPIEVAGQGRDEGLALTGLHLSNLAVMEDNAPNQLDIVVALAQCTLGGLANRRKGFGQ